MGFTGVYIIFLISAENIDCEYSLEPPRRGGSNEYPQSMFSAEIPEAVLTSTHNLCFQQKYEKYQNFLSENFHFSVVKFSVYLNRRVFVMIFEEYGAFNVKQMLLSDFTAWPADLDLYCSRTPAALKELLWCCVN